MGKQRTAAAKDHYRYGIGEWYGRLFSHLDPEPRKRFAEIQTLERKERPSTDCPFRSTPSNQLPCVKEGGVCSIRLYHQQADSRIVSIAGGERGALVTTCPYRFHESRTIFRWVGETLLGHPDPLVVGEIGFLEQDIADGLGKDSDAGPSDVGRIDNVLVHPTQGEPLRWCALEIQAVYFSGNSMGREFKALRNSTTTSVPFPVGRRRPDYRSSGPKRLMPQLQIKVPSLRRWGKKMAVVVDRSFFDALGKMTEVKDVSNCDIAWFEVRYEESKGKAMLTPDSVCLTTLESAVEGLTGGHPVSLGVFESRILEKLAAKPVDSSANPDSSQ